MLAIIVPMPPNHQKVIGTRLSIIETSNDPALRELCQHLAMWSEESERGWPAKSMSACADFGVFRWFIDKEFGGASWSDEEIAKGYLALAEACLTTTFIITQRTAASRRIASCTNEPLKQRILPKLATGEIHATVGISHLTTSRQHVEPALKASHADGGFVVHGFSPWATGGVHADVLLMGATLPDAKQILFVIEKEKIKAAPPHPLMALSGSCTGMIHVQNQFIPDADLVGGPVEEVIKSAKGAGAGG